MEKRKYHYINNPKHYDITCNICYGNNVEWSEYRHLIWCYDCEKDVKGTGGIFSGPIPMQIAQILGYNFSLYDMENKVKISYPSFEWQKVTDKNLL